MTGQFRALLLQLESEHNRQLTEQAMAHAEEVAKLKDMIKGTSEPSSHYKAWTAIVDALYRYAPWWIDVLDSSETNINLAVNAIRTMAARINELERKDALYHQIPPTPATGCRAERSQ